MLEILYIASQHACSLSEFMCYAAIYIPRYICTKKSYLTVQFCKYVSYLLASSIPIANISYYFGSFVTSNNIATRKEVVCKSGCLLMLLLPLWPYFTIRERCFGEQNQEIDRDDKRQCKRGNKLIILVFSILLIIIFVPVVGYQKKSVENCGRNLWLILFRYTTNN